MLKQFKPNGKDADNPDYLGNIFGWKISLIGAAVIGLLVAVAVYRTHTLNVPVGFEDPLKNQKTPFDDTRRRDSIRRAKAIEQNDL